MYFLIFSGVYENKLADAFVIHVCVKIISIDKVRYLQLRKFFVKIYCAHPMCLKVACFGYCAHTAKQILMG